MNTIVFVLMMNTYGGLFVPVLEFSSSEKCERAVVDMQEQVNARRGWGVVNIKAPWCARIVK